MTMLQSRGNAYHGRQARDHFARMMGQYSTPDLVRGVDGPLLLTPAADTARKQLAAWACDSAHLAMDYDIHGKGDRDYRSTSLEPLVNRLLQEMNLAGYEYTMYRAEDARLISVDHRAYVIPINVIANRPEIRDLARNIMTLSVGYFYTLSTDAVISPKVDYLVVKRNLEASP